MTAAAFLGDAPGPRARRRQRVATAASVAVIAAVVAAAVNRLADRGQLDWALWEPFTRASTWRFLWEALLNTLRAAATAMVLSMVLGALLALGRLSLVAPLRWASALYVDGVRAFPVLLLILFAFRALPSLGFDLSRFQALVLGVTAYNAAVLAEVFRAGILSLPRGQTEAGLAVGLTHGQTLRSILVPQAARRMLPAIVNQLVTLLKDTSLGQVISYEELLRSGQLVGAFNRNDLQALFVVGCLYVAVNFALSSFARWLEGRQRRRLGRLALVGPPAATEAELAQIAADSNLR
ncbi:MAG: amino acid ABC transporter permease [Acidimicrobiales bacterium]